MDLQEVTNRIRQLRDKANLSARELSSRLDKNDSYINKIESLEIKPSMEIILEIIYACNSTPEEFFYHSFKDYEKDKELLQYISKLSQKQKDKILNLFD